MTEDWDVDRVGEWLEVSNFSEYKDLFCKQHKIDGMSLLSLTEQDMKGNPLNMKVLGDIKRIYRAIENLKTAEFKDDSTAPYLIDNHTSKVKNLLYTKPGDDTSGLTLLSPLSLFKNGQRKQNRPNNNVFSYSKLQEWIRVLVGMVYLIFAIFLTSIVMTIVHDRVPDTLKYPPLPDIFLDNVPLIPIAFQAAELCGVSLAIMLATILVFHKYKLIILRRLFSILGEYLYNTVVAVIRLYVYL